MQVAGILESFEPAGDTISLEDIANPNRTPEAVVEDLLRRLPACPESLRQTGQDAIYRVALHTVVQVLMLLGPVMVEWQRLGFSSTYELLPRVVKRLHQIGEQLDVLGHSGQDVADEGYEIGYRDYLIQRFYRIEAGTVQMTTNLTVDLSELFVMPHVLARPRRTKSTRIVATEATTLMPLKDARAFLEGLVKGTEGATRSKRRRTPITALEQVKRHARIVIIGAPGSGKSTFLEWLQVQLASAEEMLVMDGQQAVPLLLRVRELDPRNLPHGAALIEKATASKDRATLMPEGWIDRQMSAGRVFVILDGLDEVDPDLRDHHIIPWLVSLYRQYPKCRYLVSARPVGYPSGSLRALGAVECDLLDFGDEDAAQYCRHWCTAVRLARNEPADEARREGAADGNGIVASFEGHPYIRNLARNPLMLSAICLVNYFEGGELPKDRAMLYRLCVEGLLHNWDHRRGIRSTFTLDEKLRTCRDVALAMQADDQAEYRSDQVHAIFAMVLGDTDRATALLEHIRYRTGLLLERRPGVFAFAHLRSRSTWPRGPSTKATGAA